MNTWIIATDDRLAGGCLAAARALGGTVTALVVGDRELADRIAGLGPDEVRWVDAQAPAEAYAQALAAVVASAGPDVLISTTAPAARVLLGAAAARTGAVVVPSVVELSATDEGVAVGRALLGGEVIETLAVKRPSAMVFSGADHEITGGSPATVTTVAAEAAGIRVLGRETVSVAGGLGDAERVVSFGRGVRARADVALVERLAKTVDAELACSMPVADDLGWLAKDRYVGRSGQQIAPRLYLAVGIAGAPQHLEGVRDAQVVAAINNDPEARIFRTADYGVVGDLYEIVPALMTALGE